MRMLGDLLNTFSQTNSCESCGRMSETYYKWFDVNTFINEKPIKIIIFIYACYRHHVSYAEAKGFDKDFHKLTAVKFVKGCLRHITGGLMPNYS